MVPGGAAVPETSGRNPCRRVPAGRRGDGPHLPCASPSQALGHKVPAWNGREPGEMTRKHRRRRTKTRKSPRLPKADGPITPGAAVIHGPSPALLHGWGWAFPPGRVQRRGRDWKPPHRICLSWGTPAPPPGSPHSELSSWSASAPAGSHGGTDAVLLASSLPSHLPRRLEAVGCARRHLSGTQSLGSWRTGGRSEPGAS